MQFVIDPHSGVPFYRQIIDQVQFAIANETLSPGERLPTVRQLAVDLNQGCIPSLLAVAEAVRFNVIAQRLDLLSQPQRRGTIKARASMAIPGFTRTVPAEPNERCR